MSEEFRAVERKHAMLITLFKKPSCQRGAGPEGWGTKEKRLRKKKPHRHRQQYGNYQKEKRVGKIEEDKRADKW